MYSQWSRGQVKKDPIRTKYTRVFRCRPTRNIVHNAKEAEYLNLAPELSLNYDNNIEQKQNPGDFRSRRTNCTLHWHGMQYIRGFLVVSEGDDTWMVVSRPPIKTGRPH